MCRRLYICNSYRFVDPLRRYGVVSMSSDSRIVHVDDDLLDEVSTTIKCDDGELIITVEGQGKPRLPNGFIMGLVVLGASAFICPGVFVVVVILLPIALVVAAGIYFFAPQLLKHPVGTQQLVLAADELRLIEYCSRTFDGEEKDIDETSIDVQDLNVVELVLSPDDGAAGGIRIHREGDETVVFGTPLVTESGEARGVGEHRVLEELVAVIESHLQKRRE